MRLARRGVAEIKVYHPRILPGPVFTGGFESVGHPSGLAARGGTVERHVGGGHCPERQRHRFGAHTEAGGQSSSPGLNFSSAELAICLEELGVEEIKAVHVPGKANIEVDFLSAQHLEDDSDTKGIGRCGRLWVGLVA